MREKLDLLAYSRPNSLSSATERDERKTLSANIPWNYLRILCSQIRQCPFGDLSTFGRRKGVDANAIGRLIGLREVVDVPSDFALLKQTSPSARRLGRDRKNHQAALAIKLWTGTPLTSCR